MLKQFKVIVFFGHDVRVHYVTPSPHTLIVRQWLKHKDKITEIRVQEA